jgi:uncharacterized protein YbbK (DUF523 family)
VFKVGGIYMIIVSACLAGVKCRYNGEAFPIPEVIEMVQKGEALALCPEVLGKLPTPRPAAERCEEKVVTKTGKDITVEFTDGAQIALGIAKLIDAKAAILKARSPSCGCGLIYDGTFSRKLIAGDGIFATLLKNNNIKVITEEAWGK